MQGTRTLRLDELEPGKMHHLSMVIPGGCIATGRRYFGELMRWSMFGKTSAQLNANNRTQKNREKKLWKKYGPIEGALDEKELVA